MSFPPIDLSSIPDVRQFLPKFGPLLRQYRTLRGLSIEELAAATQITPSALREIEAEKRPAPPKPTVKQLAAVLRLGSDERDTFYDAAEVNSAASTAIFNLARGGQATPAEPELPLAAILVFLIADIRGYTSYTERFGDQAAARLATRFTDLVRDVMEQWEGRLVEVRGDEALCAFASAQQAVRAAGDLHTRYAHVASAFPSTPQGIGIGLDIGEAVPVEGGYRGAALNRAARLCSLAGPGETLVSPGVYYVAPHVEGVHFVARGREQLKGLPNPVDILLAAPGDEPVAEDGSGASGIIDAQATEE